MTTWNPIEVLFNYNLEEIELIRIDTRDFSGYIDKNIDNSVKNDLANLLAKKFIRKHQKNHYLSLEEVKHLIFKLKELSGGNKEWRFLTINGKGKDWSFKYINIFKIHDQSWLVTDGYTKECITKEDIKNLKLDERLL